MNNLIDNLIKDGWLKTPKILALDTAFGFAIIKIVNPTALSACRDGSLFLYEQ